MSAYLLNLFFMMLYLLGGGGETWTHDQQVPPSSRHSSSLWNRIREPAFIWSLPSYLSRGGSPLLDDAPKQVLGLNLEQKRISNLVW